MSNPTPTGPGLTFAGKFVIFLFVLAMIGGAAYLFMGNKFGNKGGGPENPNPAPNNTGNPPNIAVPRLEVGIAYGTEKRKWFEWAAAAFEVTPEGKNIHINLIAKGSLEGARAIMDQDKTINVWSPASSVVKDSFVSDWQVQRGGGNPIAREQNIAFSPMVFVMWEERYQAFIAKYKELNFNTVQQALQVPGGWDAIAGKKEWGFFKFTHTHPQRSNSGLMALVMMAYDYQNKTKGLTASDIVDAKFGTFVKSIETSLSGSTSGLSESTGLLMQEMVQKGPSTYDCVFVYENVAIDYLKNAEGTWGAIHVVYPRLNIWNDNPYYILNVPWSDKAHQDAAAAFLKFVLTEPSQRQAALVNGFRPANTDVPIRFPESPFEKFASYGIGIEINQVCEPPRAEVVRNLLELWQRTQSNR